MSKEKRPLFYHSNKGQVILLIISLILIFFIFSVIILGNLTYPSVQFSYIFNNYVSLKSLVISGLRYALYQLNQDPSFTTSSAVILMPQGSFTYSVNNDPFDTRIKLIEIRANLYNTTFEKKLKATSTIDTEGKILSLEVVEE